MNSINLRRYLFEIVFLLIFIVIYFSYIFYIYIIPNHYNVPIGLFFGLAIVIVGIFSFINLNDYDNNKIILKTKVVPENLIKLILIILMCSSLVIEPISSSTTIILWKDVNILNYIRAIIFIIGCGFLPGANLYNIIFSDDKLHEKFNIEPFFLKITLYPIISFSFIGTLVLILDQLNLIRELITIFLIISFIFLFFFDLIIQVIRKKKLIYKFEEINISKFSLIILFISFGVLVFAIFMHLSTQYLIAGDSWQGLGPTNYVGLWEGSPIEWGESNLYYPIFWGYICFGLSVLSGLPYINTNALLAPFCYLYVTSVYLLMKSILHHFKEKYAVLSTILISISSALFIFTTNTAVGTLPAITFSCEFYFIYKSFAYLLFIISIAFFIIITKTEINNDLELNLIFSKKHFKLLVISVYLLILSFMLYAVPLLIGIVFIMLYCLFSRNKKKNFRLFSQFILYFLLMFIFFDVVMNFYLSSAIPFMVQFIFRIKILSQIFSILPTFILIYSGLGAFYLISLVIDLSYIKYFYEKDKGFSNYKVNFKKFFKYCMVIFTIFLIIEINVIILEEFISDLNLSEDYTFFYFLDKIFIYIGLIGILGFYLSYYCFIKDKHLFMILVSWVIISFLIATTLILLFWFQSDLVKLNDISKINRTFMNYWYGRTWHYSIIPLSILTATGLIKLVKKVENQDFFRFFFRKKNRKKICKLLFFSLFISMSYTNFIITAIDFGKTENNIKSDDVKTVIWISNNIPDNSYFLMENHYIIRLGIESMINGESFFIHHIFKSDYNETELIEEIDELKDNEIEYLLITEDFLSESSDVSRFFKYYLIPNFYNDSLKEIGDYRIYYAPYFD